MDLFLYLAPKVTGLRLLLSIGHPHVVTVLVLASKLAVIAAVAAGHIDNEYLHSYSPSIQDSRIRPVFSS